jgi:hypothetical protein
MPRPRRVVVALVVVVACYIAWRAFRWLRIDACLDEGGCWIQEHELCDYSDQAACHRSPHDR